MTGVQEYEPGSTTGQTPYHSEHIHVVEYILRMSEIKVVRFDFMVDVHRL